MAVVESASGAIPVTAVSAESLAGAAAKLSPAALAWIAATQFKGAPGGIALIPGDEGRLAQVLVGVGGKEHIWDLAGLPDSLPEGLYALDETTDGPYATAYALGWALGSYAFTRYRKAKRAPAQLAWPKRADRALVERLARAQFLARDLITTPTEDMGPAEFQQAIESMAKRHGAQCRAIVGDELLTQNYPTIHAVGRASTRPPRLIDLTWGDAHAPKLTLVGKGVCFDSGGLDIKPSSGMRMMKKDMGGAATLIALADAIMDAGMKVRLRLLVPAVENSIAGNAFRPGDVIRTRQGITVEIGNTDAEGRLILCDALTEAATEKPELIIDMATLTGAARVALGPDLPALFTRGDDVATGILAAGTAESDPLWRLPLWQPYRDMLKSPIADIDNAGSGGFAGAITAALYLAEFVPHATPWAHIDTFAWNPKPRPGRPEGGEALAFRALYAYVAQRFGSAR